MMTVFSKIRLVTFGALCLSAISVNAQKDGEALIQEARCYACHDMTNTLIGPSWQAIAQRHGGRKDVMKDVLARKIVDGGGGNWGLVPMVPNQWVNVEEARKMAEWILGLAK